MRSSFVKRVVIIVGILALAAVMPGSGADYLVIRKKDGTVQKIPLQMAPDQIEGFQVEPGAQPGSAPAARPGQPVEKEEATEPPVATRPAQPSARPPILREPHRPGESPEGPRRTEAAQPERHVRGPVAAAPPMSKGTFAVNVYKLPQDVKAVPDFSSFRPTETLSTDKINLEPSRGDREPGGIPQNTEGLGMRFMGMFMVAGEGIFRWRVYSKDGVRVHIDDKTLIENDGIHAPTSKTGYVHLAEGVHSIIVDSFNGKGDPVLKLFVQPPMGPEQVFSVGQGLAGWKEPAKPYDVLWAQAYFVPKGNYPTGPDFSRLTPIGRLISPELNISGSEGIPGLPDRKDMVGLQYQGFFTVKGAGIFSFRLVSDDYTKVTIGKHVVVDTPRGTSTGDKGKIGWAFLQDGSFPIVIDYFNQAGNPRLQLFVTSPTGTEEIFTPAKTLEGYSSEEGGVTQIPAFVYFLPPNTRKLPNFNKLQPAGMFFSKAIDFPVDRGSRFFPGVPQREEWLGLRFYMKFNLSQDEAGTYKFRIVCDDGARLIIGKNMVINADNFGKPIEKNGSTDLTAGSHEMFLDYYQGTGPDGIQLYITPPGGEERIFAWN